MLTNCLAACAHLTITVSEIYERDIGRKTSFFHTPLHSTPPLGGFPLEQRHTVLYGKTRLSQLPHGEKNFEEIFIRFGATHERDRQTDRLSDRRTDRHRVPAIGQPRLCIASRGKNDCNFRHCTLSEQKHCLKDLTFPFIRHHQPWNDAYFRITMATAGRLL